MSHPRRTHRIAAILPMEWEYSGRLLTGALDYVRRHPRSALVDIPYRSDAPNELRLKPPFDFDAALLWASRDAGWVDDLLGSGMPLIAASGDWPVDRVPCVAFDPVAVVEAAVEHLAGLRPAVMVHLQFLSTGAPVREGAIRLFHAAAKRRGIPSRNEEVFSPRDRQYRATSGLVPLKEGPARRLRAILRDLPRPAAIWCADDVMGRRVCEAAAQLGLRVPADLGVLGFGDFRAAQSDSPQLSSIPLPGEIVGFKALSVLDRKLAGETEFPSFIAVPPPAVVARESTVGPPGQGFMRRALELIAARAREGITAREVAAALSVSRQTLNARFLQHAGCTPGEEIRRARVEAAKRHLRDPRLSMARISDLCGYSQQAKFSNFFRRATGMSPREYRKRQG